MPLLGTALSLADGALVVQWATSRIEGMGAVLGASVNGTGVKHQKAKAR